MKALNPLTLDSGFGATGGGCIWSTGDFIDFELESEAYFGDLGIGVVDLEPVGTLGVWLLLVSRNWLLSCRETWFWLLWLEPRIGLS